MPVLPLTGIFAETTQLVDIDGDGQPELLIAQGGEAGNQIGYAKPDPSDPTKLWTLHAVSEKGTWAPHGFGVAMSTVADAWTFCREVAGGNSRPKVPRDSGSFIRFNSGMAPSPT